MAYPTYGYELNNLMQRYGVNSPVNPRQQEGQSDEDFQSVLNQYQKTVSATPEYNIPKGGSPTYRELLKNTLYGNPKNYFETRGINDGMDKYNVATKFGWTPGQIDQSMGYPGGYSQNWINQNVNGQQPGSTTPTSNMPVQTPTTPAANTPSTPSTPQYNVSDPNTWSNEELAWSKANPFDASKLPYDLRTLGDLTNYIDTAKTTQFNADDDQVINSGEASMILQAAAAQNLTPAQIAEKLNIPGVGEEQVLNRIKQDYPHLAYNYVEKQGYAEGGMVRGYAEGGDVDPLDAILKRYMTQQEPDTTAQLQAVRDSAAARKAAIESMNAPQSGPSDNEKWLKLAAAFANPGQTGNFMEGVGQAADVLAGHQAEVRDFNAEDQNRRNQATLAALGVDQDLAQAELNVGMENRGRYDRQMETLLDRNPPADNRSLDSVAETYRRAQEARASGNEGLAAVYESLLAPKKDTTFSEREQAQARFMQAQYEGYVKAAQKAAEDGDTASAQVYQGLAEETAAKLDAMFSGGQPSPAGPTVGSIVDGYEFTGGNPNDKGSWRPVTPTTAQPSAPAAPALPAPAEPAVPAGALEGFNTEAPPNPITKSIQGFLEKRTEKRNARQVKAEESSAEMVKSILASRDIYKLDLMPKQAIENALNSGLLTPEETQVVTAYLAQK